MFKYFKQFIKKVEPQETQEPQETHEDNYFIQSFNGKINNNEFLNNVIKTLPFDLDYKDFSIYKSSKSKLKKWPQNYGQEKLTTVKQLVKYTINDIKSMENCKQDNLNRIKELEVELEEVKKKKTDGSIKFTKFETKIVYVHDIACQKCKESVKLYDEKDKAEEIKKIEDKINQLKIRLIGAEIKKIYCYMYLKQLNKAIKRKKKMLKK